MSLKREVPVRYAPSFQPPDRSGQVALILGIVVAAVAVGQLAWILGNSFTSNLASPPVDPIVVTPRITSCAAGQFVTAVSADGVISCSSPTSTTTYRDLDIQDGSGTITSTALTFDYSGYNDSNAFIDDNQRWIQVDDDGGKKLISLKAPSVTICDGSRDLVLLNDTEGEIYFDKTTPQCGLVFNAAWANPPDCQIYGVNASDKLDHELASVTTTTGLYLYRFDNSQFKSGAMYLYRCSER